VLGTLAALCGASLIGLLVYGVSALSPSRTLDEAIASGQRPQAPAAHLALPVLGGGGLQTLGARRGEVVVLNFWASWCPPCRDEAPLLERWQRKLQRQQASVVGVDVLDVTGDAQKFIREHGLSYPQLRDADGSKLKRFDVVGYPETIVLDRQGRIAATSRGTVDDRFFTDQVVPLLKEPT
jgi:cytochrome c biogenesis protein CcmG, thiol:disulfide interchange protein DsbE